MDWSAKLALPELERKHNLPSGLLSAILQAESGGNPNAVSPVGAKGLFQFMPSTAADLAIDPTIPGEAAYGAAKYLSQLNQKFDGDLDKTLAAYNWGQGNVDRQGLQNAPAETQNYLKKVKGLLPVQVADAGNVMSDGVEEIDAELAALGYTPPAANATTAPDELSAIDAELAALGYQPQGQSQGQEKGFLETLGDTAGAAVRGLGQGVTLGHLDELTAGALTPFLNQEGDSYLDTYKMLRDAGRQGMNAAKEQSPYAYGAGDLTGALATGVLTPGASVATLGKALGTGAIFGALSGEGNSDAQSIPNLAADTAIGAGIGTAGGLLGYGLSKAVGSPFLQQFIQDDSGAVGRGVGYKPEFSPAERVIKDALLETKTPGEAAELLRKAGQASDSGVPLSLPEASGSKKLLAYEARLRENPGMAGEVEGAFTSSRATEGIPKAVEQSVRQIGRVTTPEGAAGRVAEASRKVVTAAEQKRADAVRPLYEAAYAQEVDDAAAGALLQNPVIKSAFEQVTKDPVWQAELSKHGEKSLGAFDVTKQYIDDLIEKAKVGGDRNRARILTEAKTSLVDKLDEISPAYQAARTAYAKGSPKIDRLKETAVGVLADLKTDPVKASESLFKSSPAEIRFARRVISKADPEAWDGLIATHIQTAAEKANYSPAKILSALSNRGGGNVLKEEALNAALTPAQKAVKDRLFSDLARANAIKPNSLTAANLKAQQQLDDEILTAGERLGQDIASGNLTRGEIIRRTVAKAQDMIRGKRYEEIARIFTGDGVEDFAQRLAKTDPGSTESWKLIAERIGQVPATSGVTLGEVLKGPKVNLP